MDSLLRSLIAGVLEKLMPYGFVETNGSDLPQSVESTAQSPTATQALNGSAQSSCDPILKS